MSLQSLANNVNVYAPSALTNGGTWDAQTCYKRNTVVVSGGNAYVLEGVPSDTGSDPTVVPAPPATNPWVSIAGGGGGGGGGNLSLVPLDNTAQAGVWSPTSAYAVGALVKDTTAGGAGGLYVCNTAVPEPPLAGANTAPNVALVANPFPWTLLKAGFTAGAGINLTPSAQGQTIAVSAPGGGGALKAILTGTALTPLVAGGVPAGGILTVPLQTFNLGLTPGNTYFLNVTFDGGANTTWAGSSGGSSLTASPFIANTAGGGENQIESLFGYGQLNTFSAPTATSTNANGANPVIDFPPLTYSCYYPALDTNVYINCVLNGGTGIGASVGGVAWTDFTNGWKIWASAVDLGATPP